MNESQLVQAIKVHIAKGDKAADKADQHYRSAGQHLKTLRATHGGSWAEWGRAAQDQGRHRQEPRVRINADRRRYQDGRTSPRRECRAQGERTREISP